jgi:hypothetical protein
MQSASCASTVALWRNKLAALALMTAIAAATSGSAFAQDRHPVCTAKQHDCGRETTIASCCCGDVASSPDAGTAAQSRVAVHADASLTMAIPHVVLVAPTSLSPVAVQTSPPRLRPLDLTTLFAALLI